ncbi:MAG: tripeptide aminopeptidase [Clostridia bacterium]|jgi:tripeptide aminopeptidase|nr:tripeptide aminopeptidase [Clostridia bacterium]MDN5324188.1 tripeptide aminopeptidase [Clostridia bacterium]
MINKERIITEFMELVKIDSETRNERKIADHLKITLQQLGLNVVEDNTGSKIGGNAGNLIADLPGKKDGIKILFCAHMDTVQPGKGVEPVLTDGIIKSKGETVLGSDDKAGISAILEMLRVIKENKISCGPIQVLFTVAEEGGLHGAKNLDTELIDADIAYVLDSAGPAGHIVVQGPAQNQLEAVILGKAAHAGMAPQEGINAIQIAARGITRMKIGRIDEETTANIGVIKGGKATNIIPDRVELEGEARSLNKEKLDKQCQHMQDCLLRAAEELGGKVEVKLELNYPEISLNENEKVIEIAKQAAMNLNLPVSLDKTGGGSDANILNGYGIPTANLGIGMEKVHTTEEFITVENLVKNVEYLVEIVKVASNK